MAVTDFSAACQDGIGASFKGLQHMLDIYLAGAKVFDDSNIVRVLEPHGPGHIRRRIGAVGADQGNNFGFKGFGHINHRFKVYDLRFKGNLFVLCLKTPNILP
jgi:hypothetical protein